METIEVQEINILPDYIANQIAAGEVVQRPESVVKELVENSIDAGATSVAIILKKAGKDLIHITDNGKGMSKSDLLLAPKRHATSKIKEADDLYSIGTLGFRGEALASIASVALLEIRTRRRGSETGWKLISEPNTEPMVEPCIVEEGTQIFVKNLFYNVPARRKFLRSELTEIRHCTDTLQRLALCNHGVRFVFYDGSKLVFDLPASDRKGRVAAILGSLATQMLAVNYSNNGLTIEGYTSLPQAARAKRTEQFLFLNGRTIMHRNLAHAVRSAYDYFIGEGDAPAFCLYLTIDSERVDVNVHPQKHEVKFDDERAVYQTIRDAILQALQKAGSMLPDLQEAAQAATPFIKARPEDVGGEAVIDTTTGEVIFSAHTKSTGVPADRIPRSSASKHTERGQFSGAMPPNRSSSKIDLPPLPSRTNAPTPAQLSALEALFGKTSDEETPQRKGSAFAVNKQFAVVNTPQGVVFFDVQAASERVIFDKVISEHKDKTATGQELLFPPTISLTSGDAALFSELKPELQALGFAFDESGDELVVTAIPSDLTSGDEEPVLIALLADFRDAESAGIPLDSPAALARSLARRKSFNDATALAPQELSTLYSDLRASSVPAKSPFGKPTYSEFSITAIEKLLTS